MFYSIIAKKGDLHMFDDMRGRREAVQLFHKRILDENIDWVELRDPNGKLLRKHVRGESK